MDEQSIIETGFQSIQTEHFKKRETVPLRSVIKDVLMHLYCQGLMPKDATQRVYNFLKLKKM